MYCVYCGNALSAGTVYCDGCKRNLMERLLVCRDCGHKAVEGDRFCFMCGTDIALGHIDKDMAPPYARDAGPCCEPETSDVEHAMGPKMRAEPVQAKYEPSEPRVPKRFVAAWIVFGTIVFFVGFFAYINRGSITAIFNVAQEGVQEPGNQEPGNDNGLEAESLPPEVPAELPSPPVIAAPPPVEEEPPGPNMPAAQLISRRTIAASQDHCAAIASDGRLWAWGSNANGQLGGSGAAYQDYPVWVLSDAVSVHAAFGRTAAITADNSLWAFGRNERGQIGDGTATDRDTPVWVMGGVVFVYITEESSFAVTSDNSLWAWGANDFGQLGDGTEFDRHTPTWIRDDGLEFLEQMGLVGDVDWQARVPYVDGLPVVAGAAGGGVLLLLTADGHLWGMLEGEDDFFPIMDGIMLP